MGRRKRYELRLTLPISKVLVELVDRVRGKTPRVAFFREAIEEAVVKRAHAVRDEQVRAARKRTHLVNVSVITGPEAQAKAARKRRKPERQP
jgi:hypothetical protein